MSAPRRRLQPRRAADRDGGDGDVQRRADVADPGGADDRARAAGGRRRAAAGPHRAADARRGARARRRRARPRRAGRARSARYFPPIVPSRRRRHHGLVRVEPRRRRRRWPRRSPGRGATEAPAVETRLRVHGRRRRRSSSTVGGCHDVLRVDAVDRDRRSRSARARAACAYAAGAAIAQGEVRTYRVDTAARQLLRRDEATGLERARARQRHRDDRRVPRRRHAGSASRCGWRAAIAESPGARLRGLARRHAAEPPGHLDLASDVDLMALLTALFATVLLMGLGLSRAAARQRRDDARAHDRDARALAYASRAAAAVAAADLRALPSWAVSGRARRQSRRSPPRRGSSSMRRWRRPRRGADRRSISGR